MPAWALNEPALAYVSNRNGGEEIWFRRSGMPERPIVSHRDFADDSTLCFMTPALSPGGGTCGLHPRRDRHDRAPVDQRGGRRVAIRATSDTDAVAEFGGTWSPDGAWLAYFAARERTYDLKKVRTTGEAAPVLIKAGLERSTPLPAWSPTGEWIACGTRLISPDGKIERSLSPFRSPHYVFSRDGKLLYGMRSENGENALFSLDVARWCRTLDRSEPRLPASAAVNPVIRFSLAPDGRSLVYSGGNVRVSLWLLEGFMPRRDLFSRLGLRR